MKIDISVYSNPINIEMGCDYKVWIETVIQYIDESGLQTVIEGETPQRKYEQYNGDPDFDAPYTLNDEIRDYGKKVMLENGVWFCLHAGKMRIQEICYYKKIPFDSIVSVFKFKNGYMMK